MIGLLFLPTVFGLITCFVGERLGAPHSRAIRTGATLVISVLFFAIYAWVRTPAINLFRDGDLILLLTLLVGIAGGALGAAVTSWAPRWLGYVVAALVPTIFWF